ncbi:hypothetical protein [Spirosoma pollinicola]|uniref:DUF2207 domain-containing protein n=1 Tax=Spirosoma pollinicola TaxID=2057025 RepID=A0A2K8Z1B7_9BACT|nr:hypothetical protein [Spirosoma pollinicola]AUD03667.1 hypothetical protein CWM47_18645 [Spirosoma pollinicola]
MKAIIFFVLISASSALAQNRSIYLKVKDVKTDTAKKQIVFRYQLGNIAPKDSLGVIIRRANGQLVKLNSVYGDVGMTLTDGRKKTIFWNPVADRQKFDEDIGIFFIVKIGENQGLTRKQYFDLGRWTASAGLVGYSAWEGLSIGKAIRTYNSYNAPINISAKENLDAEMDNIQHRQQQFYRIVAVSVATVLANVTISLIQSKFKLKPTRFGLTGNKCCVGVAYKF